MAMGKYNEELARAGVLLGGVEIEIRPIVEASDFGDEFTPELRQQEEAVRAQVVSNKA